MGPSALCAFRHWPDMRRELEEEQHESVMYYKMHTGEHILGPTSLGFEDAENFLNMPEGTPSAAPHQVRKTFYRMLLRQVARAGMRVKYGQRVEEYFEDEANGRAGVRTQDGATYSADIVVAADAGKSKSALLIAGTFVEPRSAGMSVYRTAFPTKLALGDDAFRKRFGDMIAAGETSHEFWLGPGVHLGLMISPEFIAFGLTPRDNSLHPGGVDPVESWAPDVDPEEVLNVLHRVPGWDPAIEGVIRSAPSKSIVHWPLLWRDLRPEWTSKSGRVVQVGDAAHSTIPASASGGTLALEDAVTLASCLQLSCSGGPQGGPLGARIYNILRYQRISCAQKMSFVNSELLGAADMEKVKQSPDSVRLRFPRWLLRHDPEGYVYEKYGQAFSHLVAGTAFHNTNIPPGHKFKPWTLEQVHQDARAGKGVCDFLDGDWS